jgi:ADP-heptose:LPS heptosyltransferase
VELSRALKVSPPDPYVYRGRWKRLAAGLLDWLGNLWLAESEAAIPWKKLRRVAVLRLDHMGDVLNALPALAALRKALPKAQIELYVGPWGREIAELACLADKIVVVEAPWFERPRRRRWPLNAIRDLGEELRARNYDLAVDLRGELRHMLALWISGTPLRLGSTLSAGRFFLTHAHPVNNALHEEERNLELFKRAGLPLKRQASKLQLPAAAKAEAARLIKALKLPKRFIAIQAACGTPAKRWMPERWAEVIDALRLPVALLGSAGEAAEMRAIAARCKKKPRIAAGKLSLQGLAAFLDRASLLLSVDSGPAHVAANLGRPLLALYSSTNRIEQWGPQGKKVRVLNHAVPCGPCELQVCPYHNECMRRIEPGEVLAAAKAMNA